jgi:hypothetical protein
MADNSRDMARKGRKLRDRVHHRTMICMALPLGATGLRGVTKYSGSRGLRYRASISILGKNVHIGSFETADQAVLARLEFEVSNGMSVVK